MPTTYLGRIILTPEELKADQEAGLLNPNASYADYLAMIEEQVERKHQAEEAARRDGFELGAPELDLSPEDEEILDRVWANLAAENAAAKELALPARAA